MNPVIRELVNQQIRQLTLKELITRARKEGISLTVQEARQLLAMLQQPPLDIADKERVKRLKQQLREDFPHHYDTAMALLKPYEHYLD
ncbi:DUF2624 family protein [Salipaludibacillus agaradhaerens]|uniref:DUF2624 family protein n=1 Tax=Salipaludibacillus agaradhaerens TaxID=76935 RepID=UPI0009962A82|nr:DUF2624 family protein [Salipaludibacillus agaradhaerens]